MFRERKRRYAGGFNTPSSPAVPAGLSAAWTPVPSPADDPPLPAPTFDLQWEADVANPLRRITFYFALAAIYIRFSVIHEVMAVVLHLNLYLLYIVMPPAVVGVIATGGLRRTFQARSSRLWMAFLVWLFMAVPFSIWRGDSTNNVYKYAKAEIIMLFVIAGLVMTWKEVKLVMYALALAGVTDLAVGRIFARAGIDRNDLALGGSTIANSNDMAVHLTLMMAFLFYIAFLQNVPKIFRLACFPAIGYGVFLILGSGSRGALIALLVAVLFTFVMGSGKYRLLIIAAVPIAMMVLVAELPRATLARLATLTTEANQADVQSDAEGSSDMRRQLLKTSILYTFQHPIFGVGPGEFYNAEGGSAVREGNRGMWHATHNSWTQISSECGIPALIFFAGAIFSAFRLVWKTNKEARADPANRDIAAASFCLMLGLVGFYTGITFVNFAYFFYEPALCALCIVMHYAARHEMDARKYKAAITLPPTTPWAPAQPWTAPAPSFASRLR